VCLRGASALQAVLQRHPNAAIRLFVVWEPILFSDFGPPSSSALSRIHDSRVIQFWDADHSVSTALQQMLVSHESLTPHCCRRGDTLWDVAVFYPAGNEWSAMAPTPTYMNGTVVQVSGEIEALIGD
jgi:hypothetical protein